MGGEWYYLSDTFIPYTTDCRGCNESQEKHGIQRDNGHTSPEDASLDAVATIISLGSGRQQVAVARNPEVQSLELLIASEKSLSPSHSDITTFFNHLRELSSAAKSFDQAAETQAKLIAHVYRMCRSEFDKIVRSYTAALEDRLSKLKIATELTKHGSQEETGRDVVWVGFCAVKTIVEYAHSLDSDEPTEDLILLLHKTLTPVDLILQSMDETMLLDSAVGAFAIRWSSYLPSYSRLMILVDGGVSRALRDICVLSRAVAVLMDSVLDNQRIATLLAEGVKCEFLERSQYSDTAITLNDDVFAALVSHFPALNRISLKGLLDRIHTKLSQCPTDSIRADEVNKATFHVRVSVHCEMALISRLISCNTESTLYIACALPVCYACHVFVKAFKTIEGNNSIHVRWFDGTLDCGWDLPPFLATSDIKESIMKKWNLTVQAAVVGYQERARYVSTYISRVV